MGVSGTDAIAEMQEQKRIKGTLKKIQSAKREKIWERQ
jgi:hypothetical protein